MLVAGTRVLNKQRKLCGQSPCSLSWSPLKEKKQQQLECSLPAADDPALSVPVEAEL